MLAVISDLHFKEQDNILDGNRNLDPDVYHRLIEALLIEVLRCRAKKMDLVLAGDIFEIGRSIVWLEKGKRPYVENPRLTADRTLENIALEILHKITAKGRNPRVYDSLSAFRRLSDFPVPVKIHYIPGNHDRLLNATGLLRKKTRETLGMGSSEKPFKNQLLFNNPNVLVRHGHEYDKFNFSETLLPLKCIPLHPASTIGDNPYDWPCFGDMVTIEVAARMPWEFFKLYRKEIESKDGLHEKIYLRMLDFDDVRPKAAILPFLFATPDVSEANIWKTVRPVMSIIADELKNNPDFHQLLKNSPLRTVDKAMGLAFTQILCRPKMAGRFRRLVKRGFRLYSNVPSDIVKVFAMKEEVISKGIVDLLVCGHTHAPQIGLVHRTDRERYYINTGTWRGVIPAIPDNRGFGRMKTISYVTIYSKDEKRDQKENKTLSFEFWSGYAHQL